MMSESRIFGLHGQAFRVDPIASYLAHLSPAQEPGGRHAQPPHENLVGVEDETVDVHREHEHHLRSVLDGRPKSGHYRHIPREVSLQLVIALPGDACVVARTILAPLNPLLGRHAIQVGAGSTARLCLVSLVNGFKKKT